MGNWYAGNHSIQKKSEFMKFIIKETQKHAKEDILFVLYLNCIRKNMDVDIVQNIAKYITWDKDRIEQIWRIAKEDEQFALIDLPEVVDWSDRKDEIWEIIEERGFIIEKNDAESRCNFPRKVDWTDKKDKILEKFWITSESKYLHLPDVIDWFEMREKIEESIHEIKHSLIYDEDPEVLARSRYLDGKNCLKRRYEITCEIDRMIERLESKEKDNVDERKRANKFSAQDEFSSYIIRFSEEIDWSNREELYRILDVIKKYDPNLSEDVDDVLQKNNPIYNQSVFFSLNFDKCPWISDNPDELTENNIQDEKKLLLEIYDRLDKIGFIEHGINLEKRDFRKYNIDFPTDKNQLRSHLEGLTDRVEITAMLVFYLNKLTKINVNTMYSNALNGFEYNDAFDNSIENCQDDSLAPEIIDYRDKRERAEQKGSKIISTLKYLRGKNNNPIPRNDNFAYLIRQAENIQSGNFSTYNLPMKSFTDFLNYWKDARDSNGLLKVDNNSRLFEFVEIFNVKVKELLDSGCSLVEITNNFIYASRALDLEEKLYEVKSGLLQQLIEYSKKDEYKGKFTVQYKSGDNNVNVDSLENADSEEYNDIIYVLMDKYMIPMTFHAEISDLLGVRESLKEVSEDIRKFCAADGVNIPYVLDEKVKINCFLKAAMEKGLSKTNVRDSTKYTKNKAFFEKIADVVIDSLKKIEGKSYSDHNMSKYDWLEHYIKNSPETSSEGVDVLAAKVAKYLICRDKDGWGEFNKAFDDLRSMPETQDIKLCRMLYSKKMSLLEIESVKEESTIISEDEFANVNSDTRILIKLQIDNGCSIEMLRESGISKDALDYAEFYQNERNKTCDNENNTTRAGSGESRMMTNNSNLGDVNQSGQEVFNDAGRSNGTQNEGQKNGEGEIYGEQ